MVNEQNNITLIAEKFELQKEQTQPLLENFGEYFVQAHKLVTQGKAIKVTKEDQVDDMKKAREIRLALANLRGDANKTRVALKEGYLRGGNAVQAIYNDIVDIIQPEETRLKEQEQFAVLREQARLEAQYAKRIQELAQYTDNIGLYNFKDSTDEEFAFLLENVKLQYDNKVRAEKRAEEERIKEQEKERKAQEKIRLENERLRKEKAEQQKKLNEAEEARVAAERKLAEEQILIAEKERAEQERLLQAKRDEEDARNKALLAPDKEKLGKLIEELVITGMPTFENPKVGNHVLTVINRINDIVDELKTFHDAL